MPSPPARRHALSDAENPEHRCLWCAKRMKERVTYPNEAERPRFDSTYSPEENRRRQREWERAHAVPTGEYGYYHDNAFCSLRCGSSFGFEAALGGFRVAHPSGDT
jgi:hypothetical protein